MQQFVEAVVDTGIVSAEELQLIRESLSAAAEDQGSNAAVLAAELVHRGKLTEYQVRVLFGGKARLLLGSYLILDEIGGGGMGRVYKAQHRRMKRVVAIKVLSPSATESPASIKRFQREVEAAAKLNHPNIVAAYDADEADGVHYLVMEYVDGESLTSLSGPHLPVSSAVDFILQAAGGLQYAHQRGVVHRDIKPDNLLLDPQGTVKILDMGLARVDDSLGAVDESGPEKLTRVGQIMGTLDFMPPEQAEDTRLADARSDIYALGCTLYYLLVGDVPYQGDTTLRKVLAHRDHPIPSLSDRRVDVPKELDAVFRRMVAKRPDERYQSMAEVMQAVQSCGAAIVAASGMALQTGGSGILLRGRTLLPGGPPADTDTSTDILLPPDVPAAGRSIFSQEDYILQEDADRLKLAESTVKDLPSPTFKSPEPAAGPGPIHVQCGHCHKRFAANPRLAGKLVKCRHCGGPLKIPAATAPSAAALAATRPIECACPCGRQVKAGAHLAGKTVKCPACGKPLRVPRR
jgi:serine/threonine protein kinase